MKLCLNYWQKDKIFGSDNQQRNQGSESSDHKSCPEFIVGSQQSAVVPNLQITKVTLKFKEPDKFGRTFTC
jgi:hypothetical protein